MTVMMCPGSYQPVLTLTHKRLEPTCQVCGREFGGQGKKYRAVNYWKTGAPRHYPAAPTCTFDDHGPDSQCQPCRAT
jgi:hypothetical protein